MKRHVSLILLSAMAGTAYAADLVDTATVVSSVAITERISDPKQDCWIETVTSAAPADASASGQSVGGMLIGGLVGGLVGNQVGDGRGNTAATAAGALAGAYVGNRVGKDRAAETAPPPQAQTRQEQRCRTIEGWRDEVREYEVTYKYNGKTIKTRMPNKPGKTIKVGISAMPQ